MCSGHDDDVVVFEQPGGDRRLLETQDGRFDFALLRFVRTARRNHCNPQCYLRSLTATRAELLIAATDYVRVSVIALSPWFPDVSHGRTTTLCFPVDISRLVLIDSVALPLVRCLPST